MEKPDKILLICMNCLYTKIMIKKKFDPIDCRIATFSSCPKCFGESDGGIDYYNEKLQLIESE